MQTRLIALAGEVASGKSEVAGALQTLLPDWHQLHVGRLFRSYAEENGLGVTKISQLPNEAHFAFDEIVKEQMRNADRLIVEGRMVGVLAEGISGVLSVWLYAPPETRVARYRARTTLSADEDATHEIQYRDVRDRAKMRQVYGLQDYRDREFYHLHINTGLFTPEEAAHLVVAAAARSFSTVAPHVPSRNR